MRPQAHGPHHLWLQYQDWTENRLDIDPAVQPDVTGTMTDMASVASASVDAVFSSHNIEHLYPYEVPPSLAEFRRVLRDDGFAATLHAAALWSVITLARLAFRPLGAG